MEIDSTVVNSTASGHISCRSLKNPGFGGAGFTAGGLVAANGDNGLIGVRNHDDGSERLEFGRIVDCRADGTVAADAISDQDYSGLFSDVHDTQAVVSAGGLIGNNTNGVATCRATGAVTAGMARASKATKVVHAGGLIGSNMGKVEDSYAAGSMTAASQSEKGKGYLCAGGLVGLNDADRYRGGTISRCYANGELEADTGEHAYVGGLAGYNRSKKSIIGNCFWKREAGYNADVEHGIGHDGSGDEGTEGKAIDQSVHARPLDSAEFRNRDIFEKQGWDFTATWTYDEGDAERPLLGMGKTGKGK